MFAASKTASVAGGPDAQFNYVTMLLHGDGTNGAQNNSFLDSSTNNFSITRNGNTTQGSFSPYGSNWSNYFDGTGDYLNTANSSAFAFGTGDFTVECFINTSSNNVGLAEVDGGSTGYWMWHINNGTMSWQNTRGGANLFLITGAGAVCDGAWHHLAIVRNSSVTKAYWDGVEKASASDTTNYSGTAGNLNVAFESAAGKILNGYMSNFRIVKGTAVYTAAFTPPTTALTAITNTSLLTCKSNRFVDTSASPVTLTVNGNPSVQRFNPFGASATYSTSVIGGSGYFDGTGDWLNTPGSTDWNLGSNNFTIESWVYPTASPAQPMIIGQWTSSYAWTMQLSNDGNRYLRALLYNGSFNDYVSSTSLQLNAWNHCAFVRESNTVSLYLNGARVYTTTFTGSVSNSTSAVSVGGDNSGGQPLQGYITNSRVVNGTALYSGTTYTVPTAPLSAVTNTKLLLNMTNGAIFDNAMMNDLETVGNAQISTSVKKYGTGSLAFDGTGDYLQAPDSPVFNLGSGNWTIESWIYLNSAKNYNGFYGKRQAGQFGLALQIDSSGVLSISASITGSSWALGGASLGSGYTTGAWMHVAVTRSGTTITGWLNGSSTGTQTLTGAIFPSIGYPAVIGSAFDTGSAQDLNGYMDDFRLTNGFCRYTTTFTPPTSALSDTGPY